MTARGIHAMHDDHTPISITSCPIPEAISGSGQFWRSMLHPCFKAGDTHPSLIDLMNSSLNATAKMQTGVQIEV